MIAQKNGNKKIVDLLLSNPNIDLSLIDKKRKSLLSLSYNNDELFNMLVKKPGINLNTVDKSGCTPLHIAVLKNNVPLVNYILQSKPNDIPIDSRTKDGSSFMHCAILAKSRRMMNIFESLGLDYNVQDNEGKTPLMVLIDLPTPIIDIWKKILMNRSLKINIKDNNGISLRLFL